jgi:chromosome segregation ATPase
VCSQSFFCCETSFFHLYFLFCLNKKKILSASAEQAYQTLATQVEHLTREKVAMANQLEQNLMELAQMKQFAVSCMDKVNHSKRLLQDMGNDMIGYEASAREFRKKHNDYRKEADDLKSISESRELRLAKVVDENRKANEIADAEKAKSSRLDEDMRQMSAQCEALQRALSNAEQELSQERGEHQKLREENEKISQQLDKLSLEQEKLSMEKDELKLTADKDRDRHVTEYNELARQRALEQTQHKAELDNERASRQELQVKIQQEQTAKEAAESENLALQTQSEELSQKIDGLNKTIRDFEHKMRALQDAENQSVAAVSSAKEEMSSKHDKFVQEVTLLKNQVNEADKSLAQSKASAADAQKKHDEQLTKIKAQLNKEKESFSADLEKAENDRKRAEKNTLDAENKLNQIKTRLQEETTRMAELTTGFEKAKLEAAAALKERDDLQKFNNEQEGLLQQKIEKLEQQLRRQQQQLQQQQLDQQQVRDQEKFRSSKQLMFESFTVGWQANRIESAAPQRVRGSFCRKRCKTVVKSSEAKSRE